MPALRHSAVAAGSGRKFAGVLDAGSGHPGGGAARGGDGLADLLLGAVAVGVDGELQAGLRGTPQRLTDLTGAQGHLAAVVVVGVVVVDVGLFDGGAGGGVAAVGEHLDAVDAQQLLGRVEVQPLAVGARLVQGDRAGGPEIDAQPGAQLAILVQAVHGPQSVHRFGDLTDGGHSVGREQLAHASPEGVVQRVSGEPGERQEVVHLLDDAGGFPGLVPQDRGQSGDAVVGLAVVAVDAGQLQAAAVEDGDVAHAARTAMATSVLTESSSARVGRRLSASFWSKKRLAWPTSQPSTASSRWARSVARTSATEPQRGARQSTVW